MKKNHYLLIVMLFLSSAIYGQTISEWNGSIPSPATSVTFQGSGTPSDPYLINSATDLAQLAANVNGGQKYGIPSTTTQALNFKLTTNIDLKNQNWPGIGLDGKPLSSNFDGDNHIIKNMTISGDATGTQNIGIGFFGKIQTATLQNLCIDAATVTVNNGAQAAVLIGCIQAGNINHCRVINSTIEIKGGNSGQHAIFLGRNQNSTINNSYVANSTLKHIAQTAGGFVGSSNLTSTYNNCFVSGVTLSGGKTNPIKQGIFCGENNSTNNTHKMTLNNCYVEQISGYSYIGNLTAANAEIKEGGAVIEPSKMEKTKEYFASLVASWNLNTSGGSSVNSKVWSHNGTNPIFADATNGAIVKAGAIDGETQTYAKGNEVLATDFKYITFDTTNSEITDYSTLAINPTNPNALIYLPEDATLSKGNVVIGSSCANLVLADDHDFVCPTSFTATKATYTRNCYIDGGWETIALPFNVTDITSNGTSVKDNYTIEGYTSTSGTTVKFTELTNITDWQADNAYILKHNSVETGTQECTFEGAGTIAATPANADFTGTYTLISNDLAAGNYVLNAAGTEFGPLAASTETATIPAFRAYLKKGNGPNPAKYSVEHDNGATGINNAQQASTIIYADGESIIINSEKAQTINVYGIDGRKAYNTIAEEGTTTINGLPKGIYIVNNQKVILK